MGSLQSYIGCQFGLYFVMSSSYQIIGFVTFTYADLRLPPTVYVLAMVGHLKNVSPIFAQMPNRNTNVEFTTVSPTIANTMLAVRASVISCLLA